LKNSKDNLSWQERQMRKRAQILVVLIAVGLISSWGVYSWYSQVLPEPAIYLIDDINPPSSGERILVFSPHPDDETIGVGGYIAESISKKAEVWIVLITDGNKHNLKNQRYKEFKSATSILGVPEDHLIFLNYPDGALKRQNLAQVKLSFEEIVLRINPQIIFAPHPLDRHPDHSTAGQIIEELLSSKKEVQLYFYLVHHNRYPKPKKFAPERHLLPPVRMIVGDKSWQRFMLSPEIRDQKLRAVLQYKTQLNHYRNPFLRSLLLGLVRENELFAIPKPTNPSS